MSIKQKIKKATFKYWFTYTNILLKSKFNFKLKKKNFKRINQYEYKMLIGKKGKTKKDKTIKYFLKKIE